VSIPKKHRLTSIKIVPPTAPDAPVGTYTLNYLADDPKHMLPSRLGSIKYCAGSGDSSCLPPLEFEWDGGGYGWAPAASYALPDRIDRRPGGKSWGTQLVDLDGDGRLDFVTARPDKFAAWKNGFNGFETAPESWKLPAPLVTADGTPNAALLADMDNDGLLDVVGPPSPAG
jgi:hypothetical protein